MNLKNLCHLFLTDFLKIKWQSIFRMLQILKQFSKWGKNKMVDRDITLYQNINLFHIRNSLNANLDIKTIQKVPISRLIYQKKSNCERYEWTWTKLVWKIKYLQLKINFPLCINRNIHLINFFILYEFEFSQFFVHSQFNESHIIIMIIITMR